MTHDMLGDAKMLNGLRRVSVRRMRGPVRGGSVLITASILLLGLSQSACFGKKSKAQAIPASEVKIAILPLNVPAENEDLRWTAMAGPILMGKVIQNARDLNVRPFWETMPTAIESAGVTRSFSQETATTVAAYLGVQWSVMGEITATRSGVQLMLDFIPAKVGSVPFRYTKSGELDEIGARIPVAFSQFAYYLTIRPMEPIRRKLPTMPAVRKLAEALDREYGWFAEAKPGQAQAVVTELAETDEPLARFLFNPTLYPNLAVK